MTVAVKDEDAIQQNIDELNQRMPSYGFLHRQMFNHNDSSRNVVTDAIKEQLDNDGFGDMIPLINDPESGWSNHKKAVTFSIPSPSKSGSRKDAVLCSEKKGSIPTSATISMLEYFALRDPSCLNTEVDRRYAMSVLQGMHGTHPVRMFAPMLIHSSWCKNLESSSMNIYNSEKQPNVSMKFYHSDWRPDAESEDPDGIHVNVRSHVDLTVNQIEREFSHHRSGDQWDHPYKSFDCETSVHSFSLNRRSRSLVYGSVYVFPFKSDMMIEGEGVPYSSIKKLSLGDDFECVLVPIACYGSGSSGRSAVPAFSYVPLSMLWSPDLITQNMVWQRKRKMAEALSL